MSKQKTISTEAQLRQAAKEALEADALLRWRWKTFELKRERGADALLELNVDGRRLVFEVEFKLTPSAREVERLAERDLRSELGATKLSDELTEDEEKRLEEIEDSYWREFEAKGTDFLVLLKGGRG